MQAKAYLVAKYPEENTRTSINRAETLASVLSIMKAMREDARGKKQTKASLMASQEKVLKHSQAKVVTCNEEMVKARANEDVILKKWNEA